ncbi:helix-turn-helix domain-containing protein [Pseudomonas chlororaphis]|uniref:helix-turn-helix domain-containing protein n=1 Tax=Pseudomonas chlororaphis TaxID=587753 RepID=UPI0024087C74|nr:helix-turn-helix domain-containing protein [Pseudomonas chlororaphis]
MTEHWPHPINPSSIPTSTLARADELVRKTAFLAGLVAPKTAACLSELLIVANAHYSSEIDGNSSEPEMLEREFVLEHHQSAFGGIPELRRRIVTVLCQHHQVLHGRTQRAGIGAFARALTFEHFALLGLHPHLWSLSRGLGRRLEEYQSATGMNDPMQTDGLEGAQKLIGGGQLAFIDFMLDVCHEEVDYVTTALNRRRLRESITHAYRTNSQLKEAGITPETMPAFLALLIQGALPRSEFVTFTGLPRKAANDQLNRLLSLGIVVSTPSNHQRLEVGLPVWFAQDLLPDFHLA